MKLTLLCESSLYLGKHSLVSTHEIYLREKYLRYHEKISGHVWCAIVRSDRSPVQGAVREGTPRSGMRSRLMSHASKGATQRMYLQNTVSHRRASISKE